MNSLFQYSKCVFMQASEQEKKRKMKQIPYSSEINFIHYFLVTTCKT